MRPARNVVIVICKCILNVKNTLNTMKKSSHDELVIYPVCNRFYIYSAKCFKNSDKSFKTTMSKLYLNKKQVKFHYVYSFIFILLIRYIIEMKYVAVCILYTMSQPILFYLQVLEDHEDDMLVSFMVKTCTIGQNHLILPYRQNKTLFVELILLNWSMKGHNFDSPKVTLNTYIKECLANQKAVVYFK